MLISMNWISEFTDLKDIDIKELINRFTLSTAEVEEIFEKGKDIRNVVVGRIIEVEKHPESKKLHLLKVDTGTEIVDCVCGAPNVAEGLMVPFAKVGGQVGELEINEVKIAGYTSLGMCCSEKELGISDDDSGLMEIKEDYPLGTDIKDFMDIEDIIFEVDNKSLTNRPDLWGHYGIAREIAVLTKRELKPLDKVDISVYNNLDPLDISIKDKDKAYRYSGITLANIKEKTSPTNMKIRLTYCGMRPINLLADLTNYLMLELGQPMHAFDNEKVKSINVKTFDQPFSFTTLDNIERKMDSNSLMICDGDTPVAIAGIMGGAQSEISDSTTSILLESANFDGVCVRRTATRLGHRTDASTRYEKVLDPEMTVTAIERFIKLLVEIDGDIEVTSSLTDAYVKKYDEIKIEFNKTYVDKYTGIDISVEQIEETLIALGFELTRNGEEFEIIVPTYRATKDVTIKADIIEEITRIYGYDNFDIESTTSLLTPIRHSRERDDEYAIKTFLSSRYGMHEVHSYLWDETKVNKELGIETKENVRIINSLTAENDTLRYSIIPSLLGFVNKNVEGFPTMGMYEIGRTIKGLKSDGLCDERKTLGIVYASKEESEKEVYFKLKEILDNIIYNIKSSKPKYNNSEELGGVNYNHPVNSAKIYIDKTEVGYFSVLNPRVRNKIDKKMNVVFAEIDLSTFEEIEPSNVDFEEVSKYPGIGIDLNIIVDRSLIYGDLLNIINKFEYDNLQNISLVDIYDGGDVPEDKKSITLHLQFSSMEKTLESKEVSNTVDRLLENLGKDHIKLR